jgi:hypothetical protein
MEDRQIQLLLKLALSKILTRTCFSSGGSLLIPCLNYGVLDKKMRLRLKVENKIMIIDLIIQNN